MSERNYYLRNMEKFCNVNMIAIAKQFANHCSLNALHFFHTFRIQGEKKNIPGHPAKTKVSLSDGGEKSTVINLSS